MANIGEIISIVPTIHPNEKNQYVDQLFMNHPNLQSVVVVLDENPIALITRTYFYQKIGTQYGYNLYMGRPVELLAKKKPLIVDYKQPITEVSQIAMKRKPEDLYDDIVVTKKGKFIGIVSIQALLLKLVDIQVEFASFLNPLTGLPGNHIIDGKLNRVILEPKYSVFYFDLDHFKAYNDTYGFKKGDKLLQTIANLLKKHLVQGDGFLGHIGGDDFIAIQHHYNVKPICEEIIGEFKQLIHNFYSTEHLQQQYVVTEDRNGKLALLPLVSLSIAIVTNKDQQYKDVQQLADMLTKVKKKCKAIQGSCYLIS